MKSQTPDPALNPDYLSGQIARALFTAAQHADPATRARAEEKAKRLQSALEGMRSGNVGVGSRTPVQGTPAWATLEVVKGGFATGALLAEGPLRSHEDALVQRLGIKTKEQVRGVLNAWHSSDDGFAALTAMLEDGCFRVEVPEEGALLVAAWLSTHAQNDRAQELLDALLPWFPRLRFYPVPAAAPLASSAFVRLQPVRDTMASIEKVKQQQNVARMNETLRVWNPFEDRLLALLSETVEGVYPFLQTDEKGAVVYNERKSAVVVGGIPLVHVSAQWRVRAKAMLDELWVLRQKHTLNQGVFGAKSNLSRLEDCITTAVDRPERLTASTRSIARHCLATMAHKRGAPGSEKLQTLRRLQEKVAERPSNKELASVVGRRLTRFSPEGGYSNIEPLMLPLSEAEAKQLGAAVGIAIPSSLEMKLLRSLEAPMEELVSLGVIPSGEVLAIVAPQITAQVRAAGIKDPALRRVYEAVYMAFRKRRSLLLLDLQSQVRLEELPWIAAIDRERRAGVGAVEASRQTLERLALLALRSFPEVLLPNKLLTEFTALAKGAELSLPLVEELASDIFMGTFSYKFVRNAQLAAQVLRGSLYERYYGISYERVLAMKVPADTKSTSRWQTPASAASEEFATYCTELARIDSSMGWSVARNGTIIEQQQILTTHNLGALYAQLQLAPVLRAEAFSLAQDCWRAIVRQHAQEVTDWRSGLLRLKNTAYAWRQQLFFLSIAPQGSVEQFLPWAREELARKDKVQDKLAPVLRGLALIAAGRSFDANGVADFDGPARRFLGWTVGKHWLSA